MAALPIRFDEGFFWLPSSRPLPFDVTHFVSLATLSTHSVALTVQALKSYTPLHTAATMDRVDVAKLVCSLPPSHLLLPRPSLFSFQLLRHGAQLTATDESGKTPLDLARANQSAGIATLLMKVDTLHPLSRLPPHLSFPPSPMMPLSIHIARFPDW